MLWFAHRGNALGPLSLITAFFLLEFVAGGVFYRVPRPDSAVFRIQFAYSGLSMRSVPLMAFAAWLCLVLALLAPARARG